MLSRVAESLYWIGRYLERAEDSARLLDVHYHALLDAQVCDHGEAWQRIVALYGDEPAYREHYDAFTAPDVAEWVLWHDGNPSAVASCITLARENARSVREQISGEMWEAINGLFLLLGRANRRAAVRGPHAFFEELRNGAHRFQGTADATMTHGEPYEFLQLGLHLERAATTVRVVRAPVPDRRRTRGGRPAAGARADRAAQVVQRLRGVRPPSRRVVRAALDRREADPLGRVPARGALLPPHLRHLRRPDRRPDRDAATRPRPALRRPRVRRCGRRLGSGRRRDAPRAARRDQPGGRRGCEGVLLDPCGARRRAREPGGTAAAMWLTVEHITRYGYDAAINEAYTELRLKPLHRDGQRCSSFVLATEPRGATVDEYLDRYGNTVHHFDLLEVHESLSVTVRSEVWTTAAYEAEEPTLSPLDRWDYLAPTRYVDLDDQVIEVARPRRRRATPSRPPGS